MTTFPYVVHLVWRAQGIICLDRCQKFKVKNVRLSKKFVLRHKLRNVCLKVNHVSKLSIIKSVHS